MKKFFLPLILVCFFWFEGWGQFGTDVFTIGSDNATNYAGTWTNGSNHGSGFGAWSISAGANTGVFIGNPGSDGMGTSGIGTSAFAVYATGSNYINISRSINNGIRVGDVLSFYWAMNFDAGGGSKGFNLKSSATTIFNVNNAGSSTISTTNGNANTNYGTSPMLVTLERISASSYSFTMTARDGGSSYTTTISSSSTIDEIEIYSGNQNDGAGQKNIYFNNFTITSKYTIPSSQSSTISSNISVPYVEIQSGGTLISQASNARELTISSNGTFTNNGTFTANDGKLIFSGNNTVSGTISFNNVDLNGGVNFGSSSTINGNLTLNAGGFVNTNSPSYGGSSTLIYNSGTTYGRGTEWITTSGAGYPNHVQISNNTTLNLGANGGAGVARQCEGNLTVDVGSTLSLNESGEQMTAALTVKENFTNNGTVTLSDLSGGDLKLEGNFDDNGTFNANSRAVFFEGGNTQNINSTSDPLEIDIIRIDKSGGDVVMNQNLLADETADPIQFNSANSFLNLNDNTLTIGKAGVSSNGTFTPGSGLKGSSSSSLIILGNGDFGDIPFISGAQQLNNLTVNRGGTGKVGLGSDLTIEGALTLTQGDIETNANKAILGSSATISETGGSVVGNLESTRTLSTSTEETFGNMGISITPSCDNLGSTVVTRTTGTAITNNSLSSISRYFYVNPTINGKATVKFNYTDDEISSFTEANLKLFFSETNTSDSWFKVDGTPSVTAANNVLQQDVNKLGYFTLTDNEGFSESRPGSGYALNFSSGSSQNIQIPHNNILNATTEVSIMAWIKPTVLGNTKTIITKRQNSIGGETNYGMDYHSGQLRFFTNDGSGFDIYTTSSGDVQLNEWNHIVGTFNNGTVKIYVNGVLQSGSGTLPATLTNNTRGLIIGGNENTQYFDGLIDEVSVWNIELSEVQIREGMCKKTTSDDANFCNLAAYYRFDENTGTTLYDYAGGNNGTLTNSPSYTLSGAAVGDESEYSYGSGNSTTVTETHSDGSSFKIDGFTGTPDGAHVYLVNESPNSTIESLSGALDATRYYGTFVVGGTNPTHTVTYDYTGNTNITGGTETEAVLTNRSDNSVSTWSKLTNNYDLNTTTDVITQCNVADNQEYAAGFDAVLQERPGSGYALDFDGSNDYVNVPYSSNLNPSVFSVSAWVKVEGGAGNYRGIVSSRKKNTGAGSDLQTGFIIYAADNNQWEFWIGDGVTSGSSGWKVLNSGQTVTSDWTHVACSYDGSTQKIFINGVEAASQAAPNFAANPDLELRIGGVTAESQFYFNGQIDEVAVWDKALSEAEIRANMCKKITSEDANFCNLLAYYRFDENTGTTLYDYAGGNNGTLTNGPTYTLSGAAIGDESAYDYGNGNSTSVTETHSDGSTFKIDGFTGTPDGAHVYLVNEAPNSTTETLSGSLDATRYYGTFVVGGTNPTHTATYDYTGNTNITGGTEAQAVLTSRADNSVSSWSKTSTNLNLNQSTDEITVCGVSENQEYAGGFDTELQERPGSGYAITFDGSNDVISVPHTSKLNFSAFTMTTWVKTASSSGWDNIFVKGSYGYGVGIDHSNGSKVRFWDQGGGIYTPASTNGIPQGEWTHIAVTSDGTTLKFYINGKLDGTSALATINNNSDILTIGRQGTGCSCNYFHGDMDEFSLWDKVLTESEIRSTMCKKINSSDANFCNLAAYYRFDENTGTTLYDYAGGNNGTLTNSPTYTLSGAAIGDESTYSYGSGNSTTVTETHSDGSSFKIDGFTGTPDGAHVYLVNEAPNSTTETLGGSLDATRYYGTFVVGGTSPSYNITYDYSANTNITGGTEAEARLGARNDNSGTTWTTITNNADLNQENNTITKGCYSATQKEFIAGFDNTEDLAVEPSSGYALDFDGVDDYVDLGSSNTLKPTSSLTVEAWVYKNDWDGYTSFVGNTQTSGYLIYVTSSNDLAGIVRRNNAYGTVSIPNTELTPGWHHFALTYDGRYTKLHVDGNLVDTDDAGANYSIQYAANNTIIGAEAQGPGTNPIDLFLEGKMDEVRIWSEALTQSEVQDWMSKKITPSHPQYCNLAAYYRFDENNGSIVKDYAGNNDGTINSATYTTSAAPTGGDDAINATSVTDATTLNLASSAGDDITVNITSGTADLLKVYRVDGAPNNKDAPSGIDNMSDENYFVVKAFGANSLVYEVVYNWDGHDNINDESELYLCSRADNASSWSVTAATRDEVANTLTLTGQTGTEFILGSGTDANPLPVDLLTFTVGEQEGFPFLTWITTAEINSDLFVIETSKDAKEWTPIAKQKAAGNSNTPKVYEFIDQTSQIEGFIYYRLKQLDLNGSFTYANVVKYKPENTSTQVKIYPNPTEGILNLELKGMVGKRVQVIDQLGQTVFDQVLNPAHKQSLNLGEVPSGYYHLKVIGTYSTEVLPILIRGK